MSKELISDSNFPLKEAFSALAAHEAYCLYVLGRQSPLYHSKYFSSAFSKSISSIADSSLGQRTHCLFRQIFPLTASSPAEISPLRLSRISVANVRLTGPRFSVYRSPWIYTSSIHEGPRL